MTRVATALGVLGLVLGGCGDDLTDLERSCAGETLSLPSCQPYELANVTALTIEPSMIPLSDPTAEVRIRVEFESCGELAPRPHRVSLRVVTPSAVVPLIDLEDDGMTHGDMVAQDGVIDVMPDNPFTNLLPPNTDVTIRAEPRSADCLGGELDIDYITGMRP